MGNGPLIDKNKTLATKMGLRKNVIFAGYRNDVESFYSLADVFVFPSLREGLSLSMMEAMACGLPCVASNIRGNEDLLNNSSLLFSSGNVDDLVLKINDALNSTVAEVEAMHNCANIKKYSIKYTTACLWQLYERECNESTSIKI